MTLAKCKLLLVYEESIFCRVYANGRTNEKPFRSSKISTHKTQRDRSFHEPKKEKKTNRKKIEKPMDIAFVRYISSVLFFLIIFFSTNICAGTVLHLDEREDTFLKRPRFCHIADARK